MAERIRALGCVAPGSYREFSKRTYLREPEAVQSATEMIAELLRDHETCARTARWALSVGARPLTRRPSRDGNGLIDKPTNIFLVSFVPMMSQTGQLSRDQTRAALLRLISIGLIGASATIDGCALALLGRKLSERSRRL